MLSILILCCGVFGMKLGVVCLDGELIRNWWEFGFCGWVLVYMIGVDFVWCGWNRIVKEFVYILVIDGMECFD